MPSEAVGRSSDVNLWRIPLGFSLASIALFGLTMIPDVLNALGVIHLPEWFTMGSIDDARAILSAMLGCVSTVLALIFSVALLVLSMVATLFGPRLLYRFLQDWVTQATIGLFMATFVYLCLVFLVTHSDAHSKFVPQVSLITGWFLVIASFDTFTGVACVDWATDALLVVADVSLGDGCWYDGDGTMRLRVPPLRLERLVKAAFDQIRQAAADNPAVLIRILDAVRRMTPRMRTEAAQQALMAQADAVREAASAKVLVKLDRDDIEAAWRKARAAAEACSCSA